MKTIDELKKEFDGLGWVGDTKKVWYWITENFDPKMRLTTGQEMFYKTMQKAWEPLSNDEIVAREYKSKTKELIRQIALSPAAAEYANQDNFALDKIDYVNKCFEFATEFLKQEKENKS